MNLPRIAAALVILGVLFATVRPALAYNSEEHKLIANMGAAAVIVPPDVTFRAPTGFVTIPPADQLQVYKNAKQLAVGFQTNNQADYSDTRKKVQDNSYWYNYAQRAGNLNLWIPPIAYMRDRVLQVEGRTHNDVRTFQFGELVALYGDYRKTCFCSGGDCYVTQGTVWTLTFRHGTDCFGVWPLQECGYRPDPMDMALYLRYIASGLWPPYGTLGNTVSNTAGDSEWDEAGWWGDEMLRIANINDWHFSRGALAWYIGMHRLALYYVNLARTDPAFWNNALHYEANALHSLTDLFAFGHIVTNRDETSYGIMKEDGLLNYVSYMAMQSGLALGGASRDAAGKISLSSNLPPVYLTSTVRNDFQPSYRPVDWAAWAKWEHDYHDYFNNGGAEVRNLQGQDFYIYGDAKLRNMSDAAKRIMADAVTASLQSLFDAYEDLQSGSATVDELASPGTYLFAALKLIPVFVEHDPDHYFDGMWTRYAADADLVSGAGLLPQEGVCTMPYMNGGSSWPDPVPSPCMVFPTLASVDDGGVQPDRFELAQNRPNPFNPSTLIEFSLTAPGHVHIDIFNMMGQHVRTMADGVQPAGAHRLIWDGRDDGGRKLGSGVYLYRLTSDEGTLTRKMTLMK
jgi:hypothetical protein